MRISILGTKGIPNAYGGFEQCAEKLSSILAGQGCEVDVYTPESHPYKGTDWNRVHLVRVRDFDRIPFANAAIYDLLCVLKARRERYDVVLQLGYSPAGLFYALFAGTGTRIVTNMAGMEWQRSKWGLLARTIIRLSERFAVKRSSAVVADNPGIKEYLDAAYGIDSELIAYGAEIPRSRREDVLSRFDVTRGEYYLLIARFQPDNNIEMVLDGYVASGDSRPFLAIGGLDSSYARSLIMKYKIRPAIHFCGPVYDFLDLSALRSDCRIYFHGHSAGGTNPSLLEAMACSAPIAAHDNRFNRYVLNDDAKYFKHTDQVAAIMHGYPESWSPAWGARNLAKIRDRYQWDSVANEYLRLFERVARRPRSLRRQRLRASKTDHTRK